MIIVMTVVMLMTFIPLAIFTQAVQQLPLARHDQDHESALAAAEAGVDDYLNQLNQNSNYWTLQRDEPAARRRTRRSRAGSPVPGPSTNGECFRYTPDTTKTASIGHVYLTSSGKSRNVHPHGEGRAPPPGLPRLPLADRLRDHRPRALGRPGRRCTFHAWEWNSAAPTATGPNTVELQRRVLDRRRRAERPGAHERRSVRVRSPDVQRRHRHVLQLAHEQERLRQHAVRRPGRGAQSAELLEHAGLRPAAAIRRAAPTCRSRRRTPRSARRPTARWAARAACTPGRRRSRCTTRERRPDGRRRARARSRRTRVAGRAPT